MKKTILAAVFVIAAIAIHISRAKGNKNHFKNLLFGNSSGHVAYLDFFRVFATIMVILTHSMTEVLRFGEIGITAFRTIEILRIITLSCNNMFFVLSGALILQYDNDDENVFEFYRKRIPRVLIPCFAYFTLSEILTYGTAYLKPDMWLQFLIRFFKNDSLFTPHFWMFWAIMMIYLEAPVIRVAIRHMSRRMLDSVILAIFVIHAVYTFLPLLGFELPYVPFTASYTSVFVLGYYLTTDAAMKHYKTFMWGALASFLLSIVLIFTTADHTGYVFNNSPLSLCITSAVFLFFRKHSGDIFSKTNAVIDILCKYSFSILMIHWYVLFITVKESIGISPTDFRVFGGIIVAVLLTVIIGLAIAIVYDNTVVLVLRSVADWIIDFFINLVNRIKAGLKKAPSKSDS